eukprot:scaffold7740_cov112-Isochrysis_galbana.AAC.11
MQAPTTNTVAATTLVNLAWAESVEAGGSRQRWRAHPTPPGHMIMGNTSFGGRARCGCRSVPGNVCVGTSSSAGPRALQPGGQRAPGAAEVAMGLEAAGRSAAGLPIPGWPGRSRWRCSVCR